MRAINEIIIHCSATRKGQAFTVADIDRWHHARGFAGIGYHYVIYLDGSIHKGRPLSQAGAHCVGHNKQSIGVCYIGGLDEAGQPCDTRTLEQRNAMLKLLKTLKTQFPNASIHGHNEFSNKACPCFDVHAEFGGVQYPASSPT